MTPQEFVAKWTRATLSERSACQQHFLDLCDVLGQPKPAAAGPEGAWYTFERGVRKTTGEKGWSGNCTGLVPLAERLLGMGRKELLLLEVIGGSCSASVTEQPLHSLRINSNLASQSKQVQLAQDFRRDGAFCFPEDE
jgi:hypothetical protein